MAHEPIQRHNGVNKLSCKPIYHRKTNKHVFIYVLPSGAIGSCNKVASYKSSKNLAEDKYNVVRGDDAIFLLMGLTINFTLIQSR